MHCTIARNVCLNMGVLLVEPHTRCDMNTLIRALKQRTQQLARWIERRTVSVEVWQPRCYTGDPNWRIQASLAPRRSPAPSHRYTAPPAKMSMQTQLLA